MTIPSQNALYRQRNIYLHDIFKANKSSQRLKSYRNMTEHLQIHCVWQSVVLPDGRLSSVCLCHSPGLHISLCSHSNSCLPPSVH